MWYIRLVSFGFIGAVLFSIAMIVLTAIAEKTYMGDASGRGAYGLSLMLTLPVAAVLGFIAGLFIGR